MGLLEPRRVAILVDFLYDYQLQLQHGYHEALNAAGVSSVTFVGRHLEPETPLYQKANDVYDLLDPERYVGMIVSAASIARQVGDGAFLDFLRRFPLPKVAVSRALPGIPSVRVDPVRGMTELMAHLVHGQGLKRFVFMGGMAGNEEGQLRRDAVIDYLSAHGMSIPPHRILTGDFFGPKAAQEITKLLEHDRDFEAVVCANDEMAFGVIDALTRLGLHVPEDVAVVGFDDVDEARHSSPPLTTVAQPTREKGRVAAELLLDLTAGWDVPDEVVLAATLKKRKSCGALPEWIVKTCEVQVEQELLSAFLLAAKDQVNAKAFLECWRKQVRQLDYDQAGLAAIMLGLRAHATTLPQSAMQASRLASLLMVALRMIAPPDPGHSSAQQALSRNNQVSSQLELSLSSHDTLETFQAEVGKYMRSLDVDRYAVALFKEAGSQPASTASLLSTSLNGAAPGKAYPSRQLLPEALLHELNRGHWLVLPLHTADLHFGILLFEKPPVDHFNVEQVRYTLSAGLHHLHSAQQQHRYTQQLEEEVRERTQELQDEIAVRLRAENILRSLNQELSVSASTDALTGIFNRAAFTSYLQREWANHQLARRPISLLLCDIDFFKQYNDYYGHLAGDECLKEIARTLSTCGRNRSDFTARYGGEEFVMILPGTDATGADFVAQRLLTRVRELELPHEKSGVAPHITVSVGAATLTPTIQTAPEVLIGRADQALYRAKRTGRNQSSSWESLPETPSGGVKPG